MTSSPTIICRGSYPPAPLAGLDKKTVRFTRVIDKTEMEAVVGEITTH